MMLRCACEELRGSRKDFLRKKREHDVDYRDVYGLARKDIVIVVTMVSNPRRLASKRKLIGFTLRVRLVTSNG